MMSRYSDKLLWLGLTISILLLVIVGGIYGALNSFTLGPAPELPRSVLITPTPVGTTTTATPIALATPTHLSVPTPTVTPTQPPPTSISVLPLGGIVYALTPDINSVGWVQSGEQGNQFGESYLYAGLRDDVLYYGAMQFNLSFIPSGSTIFSAELELTGLTKGAFVENSVFAVNILTEETDPDWSRRGFADIHDATVDETLNPILEGADLGLDRVNTLEFNAAQRSIIEERLESNMISFRIDSLTPEQASWFGWDSGYGEQTRGQGPVLRIGIIPPVSTETTELAEVGTPTPTPTFVVITSTPEPENLQTAAAIAPRLTLQATTTGTPTPLPANWVTPLVVTETPTPENTATALFMQAEATAAIVAFGTSTPTPINMMTATPTATPTATSILIAMDGELPPMTPTPLAMITLQFIPSELIGKIAFKSDRPGTPENGIYVINPDGSGLALLTHCWAYALAEQADTYSADGRYRVFTKDVIRYHNVSDSTTEETIGAIREDVPGLYWYDAFYQAEEQLTRFGAGIAYGGVWSPTAERIAFISTESQNDEIWVVNRDDSGLVQLTRDDYAFWDKHPSWSPDGTQLAFTSNRTGHNQIWVMNADGSNLYSLSRTGFNDYDPVWIKYPGVPSFNPDSEDGNPNYIGSPGYCSSNGSLDCSAFESQAQAQAAYTAAGGPLLDPYGLDADHDGLACEVMSESTP